MRSAEMLTLRNRYKKIHMQMRGTEVFRRRFAEAWHSQDKVDMVAGQSAAHSSIAIRCSLETQVRSS